MAAVILASLSSVYASYTSGITAIYKAAYDALINIELFLKDGVGGYTVLAMDGTDIYSKQTIPLIAAQCKIYGAVLNIIDFACLIQEEYLHSLGATTRSIFYFAPTTVADIQRVVQDIYNNI